MGIHPDKKYAGQPPSKSDPTLRKIAELFDRYADRPADERRRLLQQVVVNVAVGNTDAHAKNYGVLHPTEQTITLSPMYDVTPAIVINPATADMGMRVGETLVIDRVTSDKIVDEAMSWGMPRAEAVAVTESALVDLRAGILAATERFPATSTAVVDAVAANVERLLDQVGNPSH